MNGARLGILALAAALTACSSPSPVLYTIAKTGIAKNTMEDPSMDLRPLFDSIVQHIPPPALRGAVRSDM